MMEIRNPKHMLAGLDAVLDEATKLAGGADRTKLPPEVCQALDLLVAAMEIVCKLMKCMDVYDPDDPANRADKAEDPVKLATGLHAVLHQACVLTCDLDRSKLPPDVGQALDLIIAAKNSVHKLLDLLGAPPEEEKKQLGEQELYDLNVNRHYVIQFEFRSDGGPMLVGTFPSRVAALDHLHQLEPFEAEWSVYPLTSPLY